MEAYEEYNNGNLLMNKYSKVADISEGSYGLVSVAKDVSTGSLVAVKFIYPIDFKKDHSGGELDHTRANSSPPNLRTTEAKVDKAKVNTLKSLREEADKEISMHKILGEHNNIVRLIDNFDTCLILEYCSRGDLYDAIQEGKGPSTSQDIKDVFSQIISALEYCHSKHVYHRDLKPENILITDDWSIKICDWGLATTELIVTNRSEFDIGSERYMAPELFDKELESYDASKVDIWSIGIILLTLVFHKNPFQVANYSDKRFVQFASNREALFDIFSTMSTEMFSIIRFCLNINPKNRDLKRLKEELKSLKFFTFDEEYWASENEEEDEVDYLEDEFYNEPSNYIYENGSKAESIALAEPTANIAAPVYQSPHKQIPKQYASPSTKVSHIPMSLVKDTRQSTGHHSEMPHNHRADALLSTTTNLKPIPIRANGVKQHKNYRKPFNVASYGQSFGGNNGSIHSKYGSNSNKFNRQDFFTPKSVFNHYMDKYGEQKAEKYQHPHHKTKSNGGTEWKQKNTNKFWKKNYKSPSVKYNKKRYYVRPFNQENLSSGSNHFQSIQQPRKNSLSNRKPRKNSFNDINDGSHSSDYQVLDNGNICNVNFRSGSKDCFNGLKSPAIFPSTHVGHLAEEIENLNLSNSNEDDYDEVFQLDTDFELEESTHMNTELSSKSPKVIEDSQLKRPLFKEPIFRLPEMNHSEADYASADLKGVTSISNIKNPKNSFKNSSNNSLNNTRPTSVGNSNLHVSGPLNNNCNGKYVPPFRRGSQNTLYSNVQCSSKGKLVPTMDLNKKYINEKSSHSSLLHANEIPTVSSSSVPIRQTDWFSSKREWKENDYE